MVSLSAVSLLAATENMKFSETDSLLLDSQMPSASQFSAGNFFFALDGRLDRVSVWP